MADSICLFEDSSYSRLHPLVYFRPTYNLRCGILTLREKVQHYFPNTPISLHCREYLSDLVKQQNPSVLVNEIKGNSFLFINGRVIADSHLAKQISTDTDTLFVKGETVIAARVSGSKLDLLRNKLNELFTFTDFNDLLKQEVDANVIHYPWDLISNNGEQIISDFNLLTSKVEGSKIKGKVYTGAHLLNEDKIFIDEGAKVKPGAVLDAENGPIFIGKDAKIFPNAVIEGPAFIGNKSAIKIGAKIYENTSIGEVCKVGGEVEGSIIHSYSNKQHDGFLGHAYLSMWVNLGADTNNSDLKNNYGSVKVIINGEQVDSGSMFVGLTMGDHSKSAINTMFNTGTVVGVSSNVFGAGFPQKYIPSFSWGGAESMTSYDVEKALDVAKRVMARRNIKLTDVEEKVYRHIFEITREERKKLGMLQ
jgi:UDP-N-acetylglucosamine diphosphorylase / glucose-1-phosphate thymidylyltransferase / UDP-N-acetylgalactosamine diphosphorylase / glucosamine-1-phosphate N-acetyltransferase / galactosamine-1-phosphate N-acetyltransferase